MAATVFGTGFEKARRTSLTHHPRPPGYSPPPFALQPSCEKGQGGVCSPGLGIGALAPKEDGRQDQTTERCTIQCGAAVWHVMTARR